MHAEAFVPSLAWALPFAGLLLSIAVLPLAAPRFWDSNLSKLGVCALLGAPVLLLYLRARPDAPDKSLIVDELQAITGEIRIGPNSQGGQP